MLKISGKYNNIRLLLLILYKFLVNSATLRRSSRKSYASNCYYESDCDDAIQVAEALKKSQIDVSTSKR